MKKSTKRVRPLVLSDRDEQILRTLHFYRYMTALDVAYRLFSPSSLTHVREILSRLAGNADYRNNQYLYRFRIPSATPNSERVFTLGSKGRDYLFNEASLPVYWYFRPGKVKHMGYGQVIHNLILTRFLVAAYKWSNLHPEFRLSKVRTSYELSRHPVSVTVRAAEAVAGVPVIPDAWLLFERVREGVVTHSFPILLEIDRGTAYQQKFRQHVAARLEYVRSGTYERLFGTKAVAICYVTTGERPEYRETRLTSMRAWTMAVLSELQVANWSTIFRFHSLSLADIYSLALFQEPVWFRPDTTSPVRLILND